MAKRKLTTFPRPILSPHNQSQRQLFSVLSFRNWEMWWRHVRLSWKDKECEAAHLAGVLSARQVARTEHVAGDLAWVGA